MITELLLDLIKIPLVGGTGIPSDEHWDWGEVVALAKRHGVLPLIAATVAEMPAGTVPEEIRRQLEARARHITARNLRMAGELKRLLDVLAAKGIRTIAFKGPTLACRAFDNVGLREFLDLDLLVPPDSGRKAVEAVCAAGYRYYDSVEPWQYERDFQRGQQLPLCSEDGKLRLELHTSLVRKNSGWSLDFEPLWDRHIEVEVCGFPVPALSQEDLWVYLSIHGGKHRWERLAWIVDLAALVEQTPNIDWQVVKQLAEAARAEKALALALSLVDQLLVPIPTEICSQRAVQRIKGLREQIVTGFQQTSNENVGFRNAWFAFHLCDRRRDGVRTILQQSLEPTIADFQATPLSRQQSWAYWLVRPIRLLQKYLGRGS